MISSFPSLFNYKVHVCTLNCTEQYLPDSYPKEIYKRRPGGFRDADSLKRDMSSTSCALAVENGYNIQS
jgi:hypothetical protein